MLNKNKNEVNKMLTKEKIIKVANKIIDCQNSLKKLKDKQLRVVENVYLKHLQETIVKWQKIDFDFVLHTLDDAGLIITEKNTIEKFNPKIHPKLIRA